MLPPAAVRGHLGLPLPSSSLAPLSSSLSLPFLVHLPEARTSHPLCCTTSLWNKSSMPCFGFHPAQRPPSYPIPGPQCTIVCLKIPHTHLLPRQSWVSWGHTWTNTWSVILAEASRRGARRPGGQVWKVLLEAPSPLAKVSEQFRPPLAKDPNLPKLLLHAGRGAGSLPASVLQKEVQENGPRGWRIRVLERACIWVCLHGSELEPATHTPSLALGRS